MANRLRVTQCDGAPGQVHDLTRQRIRYPTDQSVALTTALRQLAGSGLCCHSTWRWVERPENLRRGRELRVALTGVTQSQAVNGKLLMGVWASLVWEKPCGTTSAVVGKGGGHLRGRVSDCCGYVRSCWQDSWRAPLSLRCDWCSGALRNLFEILMASSLL